MSRFLLLENPRGLATGAVLASLSLAGSAQAADAPVLTADGDPRAGYVTLEWKVDSRELPVFELQQSATPDFLSSRVRYVGTQTSSVLSGIPDGTRYFRVRARPANGDWGHWSEPVRFDVEHHSLATAATLMSIGALVFAATAWFVAKGEGLANR